jgi:hypothetical protein
MKEDAEDLNSFLKKYDKGELFKTEEEPHKAKPIQANTVVKNTSISQTEINLPVEKQAIQPLNIERNTNSNLTATPTAQTQQVNTNHENSPKVFSEKTSQPQLDYVETQIRFKNQQSQIEVLQAQVKTARYTGLIAGLIAMVALTIAILPS